MKIYLLPYTFKTHLSSSKVHSGIDASVLHSMELLSKAGHEVRIFSVAGDISNSFIYGATGDLKTFVQKNRKEIHTALIADITAFNPDVVFSSMEWSTLYRRIHDECKVPILYQSHAVPGFFADLNAGNLLHELSHNRLSIACVSDYHRAKYEKYYRNKREPWTFSEIAVDHIIPSSSVPFIMKAKPHDGVVRHVSALNPEKKTFYIHECLEGTKYETQVYTTSSYLLNKNERFETYAARNLPKYQDKTVMDASRSMVLDAISKSMATFVGLASYDTYTITSLESLMYGVPLILFGNKNGEHPAHEMLPDKAREKFIRLVRSKSEVLDAVKYFETLSLDDRQELAAVTYEFNSSTSYIQKLENALKKTIDKAKNVKENTIDDFFD